MNSSDLRQSYLDFFSGYSHTKVPSSSVIPRDDPTLLFTNAGMNQFKELLLGTATAPYKRAVSVQKCIRAGGKHNDLDEVGHDGRHLTFFEMLGNWSFGDYYKKEAIEMAWEYVTKVLRFPVENLFATIDHSDGEAHTAWHKSVKMPNHRIIRLGDAQQGDEENFWSMGATGPCGYCSEIYFDQGETIGCGRTTCQPGCDCDRFIEIWNLVFMEFDRDASGHLSPLAFKSVDTGMGLERVLAILQGVQSVYQTDLFKPIIETIRSLSATASSPRPLIDPNAHTIPLNVIADHIRSLAFALADGATFSNEGRGYVLRRILRRAVRHGRDIGFKTPFLSQVLPAVVDHLGGFYTELTAKEAIISEQLTLEEARFFQTIDRGMEIFEAEARKLEQSGHRTIPGKTAFLLYDTYGFPLDLTEILAKERSLTIDKAAYTQAMTAQRQRSRRSAKFHATATGPEWTTVIDTSTQFVGYVRDTVETRITHYRKHGDHIEARLETTPFYAESGGQVGDTGEIVWDDTVAYVTDTQPSGNGHVHVLKVVQGDFNQLLGPKIVARIDLSRRNQIRKNHTATHLLHNALRNHLGESVHQCGSRVSDDIFRFDFNYPKPIDWPTRTALEHAVNAAIIAARPVTIHSDIPIETAKKMGAMALFGEKYTDTVRVVEIKGLPGQQAQSHPSSHASIELCGGTHVDNTGEIGPFLIVSEGSIAAGIRRIEAITGDAALKHIQTSEHLLHQIESRLDQPRATLPQHLVELLNHQKEMSREIDRLQDQLFRANIDRYLAKTQKFGDTKLLITQFTEATPDRKLLLKKGDQLRDRIQHGIIVICARCAQKNVVLVMVTPSFINVHGIDAATILKHLLQKVGGRGGGKGTAAQGNVPDTGIQTILNDGQTIITTFLEECGILSSLSRSHPESRDTKT